jgi:Flp pilus assembly protein TadG
MSRLRAALHDDRGVTLVEFALVLPVVLVLLIGCLDFARVLNASVTIQNASREGARYATLHPRLTGEDSLTYNARVRDYVKDRVVPLDPQLITVTVTASASSDPRCAGNAPTSCTWGSQPAPTALRVSVRYPWTATAWLIGPMIFAATSASSFEANASMEAIQ